MYVCCTHVRACAGGGRSYNGELTLDKLANHFVPRITVVDALTQQQEGEAVVSVEGGSLEGVTHVRFTAKLAVTIAAVPDLRHFPFDVQILQLQLQMNKVSVVLCGGWVASAGGWVRTGAVEQGEWRGRVGGRAVGVGHQEDVCLFLLSLSLSLSLFLSALSGLFCSLALLLSGALALSRSSPRPSATITRLLSDSPVPLLLSAESPALAAVG